MGVDEQKTADGFFLYRRESRRARILGPGSRSGSRPRMAGWLFATLAAFPAASALAMSNPVAAKPESKPRDEAVADKQPASKLRHAGGSDRPAESSPEDGSPPQENIPQAAPMQVEVEVATGTRSNYLQSEAPVRTGVLGQEELQDSGAVDIGTALVGLPGIVMDAGSHGATLTVQGLEPEHLLLLRDGQRVTGRSGGSIDLNRFFALRYDQVEWVTGRASSLYGSDAIGGAVNLKTHWPTAGWEQALRVAGGNHLYGSAFAGLGWAKQGQAYMLSLGGLRRNSYDLDPQTPATSGDAFRHGDIEIGGRWKLGDPFELSVIAGFGDQQYEGLDQNGAGAVLHRKDKIKSPRGDIKGIWRHRNGRSQLTLHYDAIFDVYEVDQRGDDALDRKDSTQDQVISAEVLSQHRLGDAHWLSVGLQPQVELMDGKRIGDRAQVRERLGVFVQDEWTVDAKMRWVLVPSLRFDLDRYFGQAWTPQLSALFRATHRLQIRAGVGRGYRAPTFKDLFLVWNNPSAGYRVRGNPELRPETSAGLNLSVDYRLRHDLSASLEFFEQHLWNLIAPIAQQDPDFAGLSFVYQNVGRALTRGGELNLDWNYKRWASLSGGYRFLYTRNIKAKRPLQGRPKHRAHLRARFEIPKIKTRLRASSSANFGQSYFVDENDDGKLEKTTIKPLWMVQMALFQPLYKKLELFGRVDNLANTGDRRFVALPPRSFFVGLQWINR